MECGICISSLLEKNQIISTTQCGHVYHHDCIKNWLKPKTDLEKLCPSCRKKVDINKNVIIYLGDENSHQQIIQAKISEINTSLEKQTKTINEGFIKTISVLNDQNKQLRNDNLELKDMLKKYQNGSPKTPPNINSVDDEVKTQLREKDNIINELRRDIHDLRVQRDGFAKQLTLIQIKATEIANKRNPLATKNEDQQPRHSMSLSLKFDDYNKMEQADRLIFDD